MKSSGTWMRLEAIILSEVTQTRNTMCRVFSDSLDMCVSSGISTEARKLVRAMGGVLKGAGREWSDAEVKDRDGKGRLMRKKSRRAREMTLIDL